MLWRATVSKLAVSRFRVIQVWPSSLGYCCDNVSGIKSSPRATEPKRAYHSECAMLIAKVYEVNSMVCARYGSEMRLIAVMTDPAEVHTTLRHLLKIGRAPRGLDPSALNRTSLHPPSHAHRYLSAHREIGFPVSSRKVELASCMKDGGVLQGQATGRGSSPGMLTAAQRP
jgi:hypothetical protein